MSDRARSKPTRDGKVLIGLAFLSVAFLPSVTTLPAAEAVEAAVQQPAVQCSGRIVDADGQPVSGATVTAIGMHAHTWIRHAAAGSIQTLSGEHGRFAIEIAPNDPRFLQRSNFLVAAYAPGKRIEMIEISRVRCFAGVPLEFRLEDEGDLPVRVLDASGEPIDGVTVTPARVGDLVVPFGLVDLASPPSSDGGVTDLPSVSVEATSMVYVEGDAIGKQCLRLGQGEDGEGRVVVMPTVLESGRLVPADDGTDSDFDGVRLTLMASESEEVDSPYSWCNIGVAADGLFELCRLSAGILTVTGRFPEKFPFALDLTDVRRFQRPPQGQAIEIKLHRAVRVAGTLVDAESEEPIPHVAIDRFASDGRYTIADTDGSFEFWAGPGRIQYHPHDASQRYVLEDAFYQSPQRLPVDGRLELQPLQMQPIVQAKGLVVDENGSPVAGAEIRCDVRQGGFERRQVLYADSRGRFRFYGIASGTAVTLAAKAGNRMSASAVNLQISDGMQPRVTIEPRYALRVRGRVTDQQGDPIDGARVEVRKHTAFSVEESRWSRDAVVENFFGNAVLIRTGTEGAFASPSTPDWEQHLSLSVSAPGYRTLNTYWRDASKAGKANHDLRFGQLTMQPAVKRVARTIAVVDGSSGQPLRSAKAVFLGSRAGRAAGQTDEKGTVDLQLYDGPQLMAVSKPGYQPVIRAVSGPESLDAIVRLVPDAATASAPERKPSQHTGREIKQAVANLLTHVKRPAKSDSLYRHRLYLETLAFTNFRDAADYLDEYLEGIEPDSKRMIVSLLARQQWLNRDAVDSLSPQLDVFERASWYLKQAENESDPQRREELLGELLVLADGLTGDAQLYLIAQTANVLLSVGERQVAEDLLKEAWRIHPELEEIITDGERVTQTGVARVFAPLYAVVDPEAAIRLIELSALADEIEGLTQKARVYLAAYAPERWQAFSEKHGITTVADHRLHRYHGELPLGDLERARIFLDGMKPSPEKAALLLRLAKEARDATDEQRLQLCRKALPLILLEQTLSTSDHPSVVAAKAAAMTAAWDRRLAERFAFASLWLCEGETTILPFNLTASLAQELALYDSELARTLVEPCFEDWSWLFGRDQSVIFTHNGPLAAAATIDPAWAAELIDNVFLEHLNEHPLRRLETVAGVCQQLAELSMANSGSKSRSFSAPLP